MLQSFSKKARDDEFRINNKSNFFLDQSVPCYSSTHKPICKVHLEQKQIRINLKDPSAPFISHHLCLA